MSAPAVQRIVNTLAESGYVEQSPRTSRYRLGNAAIAFARNASQRDLLIAAAQPVLEEIAATSIFNAFLGVRRGAAGLYLLALQSKSPVVIRSSPGDSFRLHSTALGKSLLMDHDTASLRALLGSGPYERLTDKTVVTPEKLLTQTGAASRRGYSSSVHEAFVGIISLGAPVRASDGSIAGAISVAYPQLVGDTKDLSEVGSMIQDAAHRISSSI